MVERGKFLGGYERRPYGFWVYGGDLWGNGGTGFCCTGAKKISIIYYLLSIIYYLTVQKGTVYPQRNNVEVKIYAVVAVEVHGWNS